MSISSAPSIREREGSTFVRFPPQRQWGFVSVERFELRVLDEVPMSRLRHAYANLNDVKISSSLQDLERLLSERLAESDFKEIHLLSPDHQSEPGPAPLMCWGIYHPQDQRPQPFYLEGGFHALPHGVRFEFYTGILFGLGEVNAQTLAAQLLREAGMPTQQTHPTVINFDPLTELSIACCLDWGWKLPMRSLSSGLEVTESELRFLAGRSLEEKQRGEKKSWRSGVTPQQRAHLERLKLHHEGEGFLHAQEFESARIFYQSHSEHPMGALRYFELRRWLEGPSEALRSWISKSSMPPVDRDRAHALSLEADGQAESAADAWGRVIDHIQDAETDGTTSPHARSLISGLAHFARGLLLKSSDLNLSTQELERARELLNPSPGLLRVCAQVATELDDRFLAQARLTEVAQYLISSKRTYEAAKVWVELGELWSSDSDFWDSAERAYLRALEIAPELDATYYQLSDLCMRRGDLVNAQAYLERLLEYSPYAERAAQKLKSIVDRSSELLQGLTPDSEEDIPPESDDQLITGVITVVPRPSVEDLDPLAGDELVAQELMQPSLEGSLQPPPSPLSAAPSAQLLWSNPPAEPTMSRGDGPARRVLSKASTSTPPQVVAKSTATRITESTTRTSSGSRPDSTPKVPTPPRGNSASRWSSEQLDALNQVIASAHDQPIPQADQSNQADQADRASLRKESATHEAQPYPAESDEAIKDLDPEVKAQLTTLRELVSSKSASASSQTQACLDIAMIYRDKLLDLEGAKGWLWRGLRHSPQGVTLHELRESLVEIYTSTEDYGGLLEYYHFVSKQDWGDAADAHMQRASLLKQEGQIEAAIKACDESLSSFGHDSKRLKRSKKQERERVIKLKAELLSVSGDPLAAGSLLLEDIGLLGDVEQRTRRRLAARILADAAPQHAAQLYKDIYLSDPSESRLEEWLTHANYWGDPHARAESTRAYATVLRSESSRSHLAPRCLSQLAHEIKEQAPLLALDLYFESLCDHPDPDIAERAVNLAQQHHQNQALLRALGSLIPECLPGEYRGLLKLKRSFALATIHDTRSQEALTDALKELEGGVEDQGELDSTLAWAQQVCTPEVFSDYVEQLEAAGLAY